MKGNSNPNPLATKDRKGLNQIVFLACFAKSLRSLQLIDFKIQGKSNFSSHNF